MSKLSISLFAFAIAIGGANGASACDACNSGANASKWATGCCEHEPMWSDHLWDDYCNEQQSCKQHGCRLRKARPCGGCSGNMPGPGRWRPRGGCSGLSGFRGFAPGSCEAPIYLDDVAAAPASRARWLVDAARRDRRRAGGALPRRDGRRRATAARS